MARDLFGKPPTFPTPPKTTERFNGTSSPSSPKPNEKPVNNHGSNSDWWPANPLPSPRK